LGLRVWLRNFLPHHLGGSGPSIFEAGILIGDTNADLRFLPYVEKYYEIQALNVIDDRPLNY
jgi:hypothetical protein